MTIQRKIFELSGAKNNREFSKIVRRSEAYTSNMINSDIDISINLAVDMADRAGIDKEKFFDALVEHLREKVFYY